MMRGLDSLPGLLLKCVEYEYHAGEPNGLNSPECVPIIVLDHLQNPGAFDEMLQRFCRRVLSAGLRQVECCAHDLSNRSRKSANVFSRRADPAKRLRINYRHR